MINEQLVATWAQDAIAQWLPGPTDYDEVLEAPQYRIRRVDPQTYDVEELDGRRVGRYRIVAAVVAL